MAKGKTTMTKTDILGTMQLYSEVLGGLLAEGRTVKTPTGSFSLNAAGSIASLDDSFLPLIRLVESANGVAGGTIIIGGLLLAKGSRLRFDANDQRQGLFYLAEDGTETRAPYFPVNLPASIMAAVPTELPPGTFSLAERTAPNGKDLREGRYDGVVIAGS